MTEPKFIVQTYKLAGPYDLSNAKLGERHVCDPEPDGHDMYFPPDGHSMFTSGYGKHSPSIFRFDLAEPWRVTSSIGDAASQVFSVAETFSSVNSFQFSACGRLMLVMGYEQMGAAHDSDKIRKANSSIVPIPERPAPPHVHYKRKWGLFDFLLITAGVMGLLAVVGQVALLFGFAP
jgi:hypothetical protein